MNDLIQKAKSVYEWHCAHKSFAVTSKQLWKLSYWQVRHMRSFGS